MRSVDGQGASCIRRASLDDRRAAQLLWAAIDSPWVRSVDQRKYAATVDAFRRLDPSAMVTDQVGFAAFPQAFNTLRSDKSQCKILLRPDLQ